MKLATDGARIKTIAHLESEPRSQGTTKPSLARKSQRFTGI